MFKDIHHVAYNTVLKQAKSQYLVKYTIVFTYWNIIQLLNIMRKSVVIDTFRYLCHKSKL